MSQFPPDQFKFNFPFGTDSSLLTLFFGAASYYPRRAITDFKEFIKIFTCHIDSTSYAQYILPQFSFDAGANLVTIVINLYGFLQVSILQLKPFDWDPT